MTSGGITLKGTLVHQERNLVTMKARMSGKLRLSCDICAEEFEMNADEELELLICDGIYNGSEDADLDIVEMTDSIDMDELLHSEIELIKSDYHSCEQCKTQERN